MSSITKPILYYAKPSPPSRTVVMVAKAIGLDLDLKLVNLHKGEHLKESFLKLNPQHTVPTLNDNGLVLWDSHAISTYLLEKYDKKNNNTSSLYPKDDPYIRAKITQRMQFNTACVFSILREIMFRQVLHGDFDIRKKSIDQTLSSLKFMEIFLNNDKFLVGNEITLADLSLIPSITTMWRFIPLNHEEFPKTADWINRMNKVTYVHEINTKWLNEFAIIIELLVAKNKSKVISC